MILSKPAMLSSLRLGTTSTNLRGLLCSHTPLSLFTVASPRRFSTTTDMSKKSKAVITDTALHIIKGATVKVLNTPLTLTTEAKSATKGRLTVAFDSSEKPTEAQINEIQKLANEKISQNVPLETIKIDRKQAEEQYKKNPVNNTYIYDNFPVPDSIQELSLVHIADWTINCCPSEHFKTTGEVGGIKITGVNHRPHKKELEIAFDIVASAPAATPSSSSSSSKAPAKASKPAARAVPSGPAPDDVAAVTQQILNLVLAQQQKPEEKEKIATKIESLLVSMKNTAYTNGMKAALRN